MVYLTLKSLPYNHEVTDFRTYRLALLGNACLSSQPVAGKLDKKHRQKVKATILKQLYTLEV